MGDAPTPLYAQFDGDDVDGKRYKLGEPLADSADAGTRLYPTTTGRFGGSRPANAFTPPVASDKPVGDMTRDELVETILAAGSKRLDTMGEDELRDLVERDRSKADQPADEGDGDDKGDELTGDEGGAGDQSGAGDTDNAEYEALKDKPLGQMKTAELEIVAKAEGVDLADADTNPKRVAAIQTKRDAPTA